MTNKYTCALEKFTSEALNGKGTMNRFTAILFETFKQIVGEQFDEHIHLIRSEIICWNSMDREAALGFFDVVFHAASLIVKAP